MKDKECAKTIPNNFMATAWPPHLSSLSDEEVTNAQESNPLLYSPQRYQFFRCHDRETQCLQHGVNRLGGHLTRRGNLNPDWFSAGRIVDQDTWRCCLCPGAFDPDTSRQVYIRR